MKPVILAGLALSLAIDGASARGDDFRATAPAIGESPHLVAPSIRATKLANGVRILVVERHGGLPIVSLRLVSDVGAFGAEPGVASLAAKSAFRGEHDLLRSFIETSTLGGIGVGWDGIEVRETCLAPALDSAIGLAWDAATDGSFHRVYVNDARDNVRRDREDDRWSARHALHEELYPKGDPMHDGLWGPPSATESVKPEELGAYFARAFAPEHVTLVVVGDTTLEAVTESAKRAMGDARAWSTPVPVAPALTTAPKRELVVVDRPGSTQSTIAIGAIGVPRGSVDAGALHVLAAAMRRRLDATLRQRLGLTYGFNATALEGRARGTIVVEGKVETSHTGESLKQVLAAIDGVRAAPLEDAELATAKTLCHYLDPRHEETTAAAADALAALVEAGLPLDAWPRERAAVDKVTKEDVLRVARAYLDPAHMPIVIVGDTAAIKGSLADIGGPVTFTTP